MARILIAEDTQYVQILLKKILEDEGYQIDTAMDGPQAVKTLLNVPVDLLLLDLHLPQLDGIAVIEKAHEHPHLRKLPFVVVSGFVDADLELRLAKSGVIRVLQKPVDRDDLLNAVAISLRPGRRILLATEDPEMLHSFSSQLKQLGYFVEICSDPEVVEKQILYRAFDALLLWGDFATDSRAEILCRALRSIEHWLPIFVPQAAAERLRESEVIPVAAADPDTPQVYTLLADQIGLQRTSEYGNLTLVRLAGRIDRDDVLEDAVRQAVACRHHLLFDVRQVGAVGPYAQRVFSALPRMVEEYHLHVGFLIGSPSEEQRVAEWTQEAKPDYRIFTNEREAVRAWAEPSGA